jgi:dienelactone hydrolase
MSDLVREVARFRAAWSEIIGPIPQSCVPLRPREEPLGLDPDELAQAGLEGLTVRRVSYRGAHGQRIPAFLLIPAQGEPGPRPAVLVMHQFLMECGKKEPIGACRTGSQNLALARDLAQQLQVVTLAPDSVGFGERAQDGPAYGQEYPDAAPLLARFPDATLTGLRISDVRRGIDFLQGLPEVDPDRIGMIGHSNGGIETLFSAAFEGRIRCALSNAGPNLVRRETRSSTAASPGIDRWASYGYLPAMGFYDQRVADLPVEMHQLYALVAPRGLYVALMEDDSIAPRFDRIGFAFTQAQAAFAALGGDFQADQVVSGYTPACRDQWAVASCLSLRHDRCTAQEDVECLARYAAVGLTASCVAQHGASVICAGELVHALCPEGALRGDEVCLASLWDAGVDLGVDCVEEGFEKGCARDHGFYPQTRENGYRWLAQCLSSRTDAPFPFVR